MQMSYFRTEKELVEFTNNWCEQNIIKYKADSMFVPAGNTPKPIYKNWNQQKVSWLEGIDLFQIDDVYDGPDKNIFRKFFKQELSNYKSQLKTPDESRGQSADLAILGIGKNGHVAFHEPGQAESFFYGVVPLSQLTTDTLGLESGTKGITYGVTAFLQAKAILLIVAGEQKSGAFKSFLLDDFSQPANFLKKHPNIAVLVDENLKTIAAPNSTVNEPRQAINI